MITNYMIPPLEQKIIELYKVHRITKPEHLSVESLAAKFNVWVHYHHKKSKGIEISPGMYTIFLDRRLPEEKQRLEFLHELCHMLRHAGNQTIMPELFTQAQESEADRFVYYAAIPFFMLEKLRLSSARSEAIGYISREFSVPLDFAKTRYEEIEDRVKQGVFLSAIESAAANYSIIRDSSETYITNHSNLHIRAYYSWDGDYSRPHTLIIEQPGGFDWDNPLEIEVDGNYESCDMPSYMPHDSATLLSGDLSISADHKGSITIDLSRVASRQGKLSTRLFLSMEAIEDAMYF